MIRQREDSSLAYRSMILTGIFIVLVIIIGCEPTESTVRRLNNQEKLMKIALRANNFAVREAATRKLTNQELLAQLFIEYNGHSYKIDEIALEKLSDQNLLAQLVISDLDNDYGSDFINIITDQELLRNIADSSKNTEVQIAAIDNLSDAEYISKKTTNSSGWSLRKAAASRLFYLYESGISINHESAYLMFIRAISDCSYPYESQKYHVFNSLYPAIDLLCNPDISKYLGDIRLINADWKNIKPVKYYNGDITVTAHGGEFLFSVVYEKAGIIADSWMTEYPDKLEHNPNSSDIYSRFIQPRISWVGLIDRPINNLPDQYTNSVLFSILKDPLAEYKIQRNILYLFAVRDEKLLVRYILDTEPECLKQRKKPFSNDSEYGLGIIALNLISKQELMIEIANYANDEHLFNITLQRMTKDALAKFAKDFEREDKYTEILQKRLDRL